MRNMGDGTLPSGISPTIRNNLFACYISNNMIHGTSFLTLNDKYFNNLMLHLNIIDSDFGNVPDYCSTLPHTRIK